VSVTIESKMGNPVKVLLTDGGGSFRIPLLPVGEYRILAELAGFQPVRHVGVLVSASRATSVAITLERRPPPITSVTQVENSGASAATSSGRVIRSDEIRHFQYRRDAADVLRGTTALVRASDGREGLGLASLGLPASWTQVVVDGVPDLLLRHPGYPADPAALPVFGRFALDQMQVLGAPTDLEWRGTAGSIVAMQTRRGENRLTFSPYATFSSASIAKRPTENPADSAATSFEVGAVLSGPIVRDTAQFQLHFNYQSLERPTPFPWENNAANYQGQGVSLRQQLAAIAADSFGTAVDGYLAPVVRSWRVINGGGRVDWRLSNTQSLMARFDYSDVREHAPQLGEDLVSGAQTELSARDLSGAVTLTRVGDGTANELRTGFTMAKRTYTAAPLPETRLVAEGVAFGGSAALPGGFDVKAADLSDAFQVTFGRHQLKLGGNLTLRSYSQDYLFGAAGVYTFGDLDQFGAARGTFFQTVGPSRSADFNATEFGLFLQDTWALSPEIQLLLGIRYEAEFLPKTKATSWDSLTGVRTALFKNDTKRIQPRVGFIWDVQNKGEWIVRGSTGLSNPRISPALIAEALLYDGRITVNRGLGTFTGWPTLPESAALVNVGPRITILNSTVRSPRSFKSELGLSRNLGNGFSLNLSGSYDHTDFLARRTDLNLA
jgi:outer membrane receptor for ferrienterochelin and colicin